MPEQWTDGLNPPHGGQLVNRMAPASEQAALQREAATLPGWSLNHRQLCDLELLLNGGFSPLQGFLTQTDYESVLSDMRLANGLLWPMPITLDVSEDFARGLNVGDRIALRDPQGLNLAILTLSDLWRPDRLLEARQVFDSEDPTHPGVAYLLEDSGPVYLGGTLTGIQAPVHHDFQALRQGPAELRRLLAEQGWQKVVAFQTRNPMHRAHQELTRQAARQTGAAILIHPVVGQTRPGDIDHYTRVRCYQHLLQRYQGESVRLSLLPLAMRMGGPAEALWHAIIRKNFGASHFIVGRDHAGPGKNALGEDFYGPYEAQELVKAHADELGIEMVPFRKMVYVAQRGRYLPAEAARSDETVLSLSGTELRQRLKQGEEIPDWFTWPEVAAELRHRHPPRHRQGITLFFTGLSGSGKSTIAEALNARLLEQGQRRTTLLDGDVVRRNLSEGLGFSREDRDRNILRIAWVASQISRHGGIAICAQIAPYADTRQRARAMVEAEGGFVEIHVSTPLATCEQRDRKGLYALARAGKIKGFTGISDPYEPPKDPELTIDTRDVSPDAAVDQIIHYLEQAGYLRPRHLPRDAANEEAETRVPLLDRQLTVR
ncbi:sulfate adenylyltransferase [Natronospira proteinivora]|uniref:Adenylyl-sulfate kinase n=1 Tax=Natronospira proteinivora TaxID=1807133 RepID=A0ABT1G901_9GAMM|nr:bifunctional sulfate adenylyltransferase/adenylylsulfate kinase [Natronospira proteinivora]MCP1727798.1 sulfate adenylyltransferase [Natronospira proteinivora]